LPVMGDWLGSGYDTTGLYDPLNGRFYLRDTNTDGGPDQVFDSGILGGTPLAGRWNSASTHDGVGVVSPASGIAYLWNDTTPGESSNYQAGVIGLPGDLPVAGGPLSSMSGTDAFGLGIFRQGSAQSNSASNNANSISSIGTGFYLNDYSDCGTKLCTSAATTYSGINITDAPPSDSIPVAGDWFGVGHSGVGLYSPSTGKFYLRNDVSQGSNPSDLNFTFAPTAGTSGNSTLSSVSAPHLLPVAGHMAASAAPQADYIVTSAEDSAGICPDQGDRHTCTLRTAITDANSDPTNKDVKIDIHIPRVDDGTVIVLNSDLQITHNLTITGDDLRYLTISGYNKTRIFSITNPYANVTISNLSLVQGYNSSSGGGIYNLGNLWLNFSFR